MSLVSSRLSLIHRCTIERAANADGDDGWGNPPPPEWVPHLTDLPCRAWTAGEQPMSHDGAVTAVLVEVRLLVPLSTDVTESDRINTISHRGEPLYAGLLAIHAVLPRRDHLELALSKAT